MAAGVAVVSSDFPLLRRIVTAADCGHVVNPLDVNAIAGAILSLVVDPDHAIAQGANGRHTVQHLYSWESEAKSLLSIYGHVSARIPVHAD
jgi:glycosyltransferase involved in cell wall biosynthesis